MSSLRTLFVLILVALSAGSTTVVAEQCLKAKTTVNKRGKTKVRLVLVTREDGCRGKEISLSG